MLPTWRNDHQGSRRASGASYTDVDTGASLTNLDPCRLGSLRAVCRFDADHWIVRPAIAEALSKIKIASGSNQSLSVR